MTLAVGTAALAPAPPVRAEEPLWTERSGARPADDSPVTYGDFKRLAKQLSPAVVSIEIRKRVEAPAAAPFFPFFGRPDPEREAVGGGSGFIIRQDGLIITNNHVVEGATEIQVHLLDGRAFPAKTVGADPATGIALLDVDAEGLSVAPLGDSERLEVGEWVVEIGNPFGLAHTVTAGIVSAKGRRDEVRPDVRLTYRDFIQTDASINRGNSGGPLISLSG